MAVQEQPAVQSVFRKILRAICDVVFKRRTPAPRTRPQVLDHSAPTGRSTADHDRAETSRRLADEAAALDRLDAERERRGDAGYGKVGENRIVWGELIELELQDLDEKIIRICDSSGEGSKDK